MASIHQEILIDATPDTVWDAVADIGALHTRLAPGFVVDTQLVVGADPAVRIVTFGNGAVAREVIIDRDDIRRRLVWTIQGESVAHHNGAIVIVDAGEGRSRVVWTADVLPHALADVYGPAMGVGLGVMKSHLERPPARA